MVIYKGGGYIVSKAVVRINVQCQPQRNIFVLPELRNTFEEAFGLFMFGVYGEYGFELRFGIFVVSHGQGNLGDADPSFLFRCTGIHGFVEIINCQFMLSRPEINAGKPHESVGVVRLQFQIGLEKLY